MKFGILISSLFIFNNLAIAKNEIEITPTIKFKPDYLEIEVEPGSTKTDKVYMQNTVKTSFSAIVEIEDAYLTPEGKIAREKSVLKLPEVERKKYIKMPSIKEHIILNQKTFSVENNNVMQVPIGVKAPANAEGTYYFMFSIQPQRGDYNKIKKAKSADKNLKSSSVGVLSNEWAIGTVSIKNKTNVKFDAENKITYTSKTKQLMIQSTLKNTGTDFVRRYEGLAVVLSKSGNVMAKVPVISTNKASFLVPKASRLFVGSGGAKLDKGQYEVVLTFQDEKGKKMTTFKELLEVK